MSCEWFVKGPPPCESCGREYGPVRIGISAIGWTFGFDPAPGSIARERTMDAWRPALVGETILDEYGKEHTPEEFEAFVARKAHLRNPRKTR